MPKKKQNPVVNFLCVLFGCTCECEDEGSPRIKFSMLNVENTLQVKGDIMAFQLPIDKKVTVSISPVDAKGNPAKVEGAPVWAFSDPTQCEVVPSADGMSAVLSPLGPLGTGQLNVTADADLGEGVKPISGLLEVETIGGEAVGFTINTGALETL
jgi:hypothetical protein